MIDFFYGLCINDTDVQEITKTEVGITKTEVVDFWLLYTIQIPNDILEQTHYQSINITQVKYTQLEYTITYLFCDVVSKTLYFGTQLEKHQVALAIRGKFSIAFHSDPES